MDTEVDRIGMNASGVTTMSSQASALKIASGKGIKEKISAFSDKALWTFNVAKMALKVASALSKALIPSICVAGALFAASLVASPIVLAAVGGLTFLVFSAVCILKFDSIRAYLKSALEEKKVAEDENKKIQKSAEASQNSITEAEKALKKMTQANEELSIRLTASIEDSKKLENLLAEDKKEKEQYKTIINQQAEQITEQQSLIDSQRESLIKISDSTKKFAETMAMSLAEQSQKAAALHENIEEIRKQAGELEDIIKWADEKIAGSKNDIQELIEFMRQSMSKQDKQISSEIVAANVEKMTVIAQHVLDNLTLLQKELPKKIAEREQQILQNTQEADDKINSINKQISNTEKKIAEYSAKIQQIEGEKTKKIELYIAEKTKNFKAMMGGKTLSKENQSNLENILKDITEKIENGVASEITEITVNTKEEERILEKLKKDLEAAAAAKEKSERAATIIKTEFGEIKRKNADMKVSADKAGIALDKIANCLTEAGRDLDIATNAPATSGWALLNTFIVAAAAFAGAATLGPAGGAIASAAAQYGLSKI